MKIVKEFKEFIMRGNVMDMAVGVIIGGAFTAIVTSLTEDILSPFLGLFGGANFDTLKVEFLGVTLNYGKFITAIINFLIIALVIFLLVKGINKVMSLGKKKVEEAPTTKVCPCCFTEIDIRAIRCPHCTSEIPETPVE